MSVVRGLGLSTPLGRTARATVAAMAAGIVRYELVEAVTDLAGEPARASRRTNLDGEDALARALVFAREALREAISGLPANTVSTLPVYLAAPREAASAEAQHELMRGLERELPPHVALRWVLNSISTGGREAGGVALAAAVRALQAAPVVLVGGLDCLSAGGVLEQLARANLVLGDSNPDGRLGGEGAAFLLLARGDAVRAGPALGVVHALASARDPRPFAGELANAGEGLTAVFSQLRQSWPTRVDQVVMAQSHERFWGGELSMAYLRNVELMPEPMVKRELARDLGDCGAATLLMGIVWSLIDFDPRPTFVRDTPLRRSAVVYACSDEGQIVGVLVHAQEMRRGATLPTPRRPS